MLYALEDWQLLILVVALLALFPLIICLLIYALRIALVCTRWALQRVRPTTQRRPTETLWQAIKSFGDNVSINSLTKDVYKAFLVPYVTMAVVIGVGIFRPTLAIWFQNMKHYFTTIGEDYFAPEKQTLITNAILVFIAIILCAGISDISSRLERIHDALMQRRDQYDDDDDDSV